MFLLLFALSLSRYVAYHLFSYLFSYHSLQIQASGQRIEYFETAQMQCGVTRPLKIPLHNNTRWGTAHGMLNRAFELQQSVNLFTSSADALFGPITTIRTNGRLVKHIPWTAFKFTDTDWARVNDVKDILTVRIFQGYFSLRCFTYIFVCAPAGLKPCSTILFR